MSNQNPKPGVPHSATEAAAGATAPAQQPFNPALLAAMLTGQVPQQVIADITAKMQQANVAEAIRKVDLNKIDMTKLPNLNPGLMSVEERALGAALAEGSGNRQIARALRGEPVTTGMVDTVLNVGETNVKVKHVVLGITAAVAVIALADYFGKQYKWGWRPGIFFNGK